MAGADSTSTLVLGVGRADGASSSGVHPAVATTSNPLTRSRIERLAARAVAGFSWVFALQVIPVLVQQAREFDLWYTIPAASVLFASLAWLAVASLVRRTVRFAAVTFCAAYLLALCLWSLETGSTQALGDQRPWLWYLLTVATACAALALPLPAAIAYTVLAPAVYALVLVLGGGNDALRTALLDSLYALIFAFVLLAIMTMLRQASSQVDERQSAALEQYAAAVRGHALEADRVEVDAIVHDSVLATLLAAAAARTTEARAIAASMATDALRHLDTSAPTDVASSGDDAVTVERLRERLVQVARSFAVPFAVDPVPDRPARDAVAASTVAVPVAASPAVALPGAASSGGASSGSASSGAIPMLVAEALYNATVQAMVNSVQHAGAGRVHRTLAVHRTDGGIEIVVRDDGSGFDVAQIPPRRLGVEVSIRERVAMAGGEAMVVSSPHRGTTVTLRWSPARRSAGEQGDEQPATGDGA
jgi:hypothetical protein